MISDNDIKIQKIYNLERSLAIHILNNSPESKLDEIRAAILQLQKEVTDHIRSRIDLRICVLKSFADNINTTYRDLFRKCELSGYIPMEVVNELYRSFKETIERL